MRILIVSDTHGREWILEKVLKEIEPVDHLIHLGDVIDGEDYIRAIAGVPVDMVAGNNDFFSNLPSELILQLGKHRVLLTHGHAYYVYRGVNELRKAAVRKQVDIVMYGHTHCPNLIQEEGLTILNPGSISLPRQENGKPSYMVMEMDDEGNIEYHIFYVELKK